MSRFRVFLADLFHDGNIATNVIPLNIGYLANALKVTFKDSCEIKLFKYPESLIRALEAHQPDLVCLSNYIWNARLSLRFARYIKSLYPGTVVIMGGPNVRHDLNGLMAFIEKHPEVDGYIPFTGELPLVDLTAALLKIKSGKSAGAVSASVGDIAGVYLAVPGYSYVPYDSNSFKDSFKFGSPYLNGVLDEFLADERLSPVIETNRGCPYSCTYCSWGVSALSHVYKKDFDIVRRELEYIVKNGVKHKHWVVADANFGIFPRDVDIARVLRELRDEYGYPLMLNVNWAKMPSANVVYEMSKILGDMITPQIALQSRDKKVLKASNRINLNDADVVKLIDMYHREKRGVQTDILVGLSGETPQSHRETMRQVFELGFDHFNLGSIQVLPGSDIDTVESRRVNGWITKYRRLSGYYGVYLGGLVYEVEENICGSRVLPEADFFNMRETHYLAYALWSSGMARDLLKLGMKRGIAPLDVFDHFQSGDGNETLSRLLAALREDLAMEQFPSEDALDVHIKETHMQDLIMGGKIQDKLMWKYLAQLLAERGLLRKLVNNIAEYIAVRTAMRPSLMDILKDISADRIKLDFDTEADATRLKQYVIAFEDYQYLVESGFLPEGLRYHDRILYVQYFSEMGKHLLFMELLEKCRYRENPVEALYRALHYGLIFNLNYDIRSVVPDRDVVYTAEDGVRVNVG